jgi:hypothetical protein
MHIIRIDRSKGTETVFNEIMEDNFSIHGKDMYIKVYNACITPKKLEKTSSKHILVKLPILKAAREKCQVTDKGSLIRIAAKFSAETLKVRNVMMYLKS